MSQFPVLFNSEYLNDYLRMVEDTESPRLFHIWSALSAISAALGRRCWLPFGPMVIFPNQYILLVGTPGTRKSTAASMAKRMLRKSTGVRFAPADTAGQRQGLVEAMRPSEKKSEHLDKEVITAASSGLLGLTLNQVAEISNEAEEDAADFIADADKHHIMVVASEFSRFIGQNNLQMLDFLTTMWDGDDYEYKTKLGEVKLPNPLINLLGCTTPVSIASSMPSAAGGQGFLSRIILVYGERKYKKVARPPAPSVDIIERIKSVLRTVYYEMNGEFNETPEARAYSESLYDVPLGISDSRFGYYAERRYTHLLKLGMVLAASRGTSVIERVDYDEAHRILRATERGMPDALGQFGLNPLAAVKQNVLEYVRQCSVVPVEVVRSSFHRDARPHELIEVINDLVKSDQIKVLQLKDGTTTLHARYRREDLEDTEDAIMQALQEK